MQANLYLRIVYFRFESVLCAYDARIFQFCNSAHICSSRVINGQRLSSGQWVQCTHLVAAVPLRTLMTLSLLLIHLCNYVNCIRRKGKLVQVLIIEKIENVIRVYFDHEIAHDSPEEISVLWSLI